MILAGVLMFVGAILLGIRLWTLDSDSRAAIFDCLSVLVPLTLIAVGIGLAVSS